MLPCFSDLLFHVKHALSGERLAAALSWYALRYPVQLSDMMLAGEHPDYMLAAIVAVNTDGE